MYSYLNFVLHTLLLNQIEKTEATKKTHLHLGGAAGGARESSFAFGGRFLLTVCYDDAGNIISTPTVTLKAPFNTSAFDIALLSSVRCQINRLTGSVQLQSQLSHLVSGLNDVFGRITALHKELTNLGQKYTVQKTARDGRPSVRVYVTPNPQMQVIANIGLSAQYPFCPLTCEVEVNHIGDEMDDTQLVEEISKKVVPTTTGYGRLSKIAETISRML